MKKPLLSAIAILALASSVQVHADTIAQWTFETSAPTTAGPLSPEAGSGSALGHGTSLTYSSPAGNGSSHSFSAANWSVGDYYQFQVSAANFSNIQLSFDQTSSNTGPRDFKLAYSTNGTTFFDVTTYSVLANASPNTPWASGTPRQAAYTFTDDLSSIDDLNGATTVYFRLIDTDTTSANGGAVGTGGTDRVDNVLITGVAAAPEPSSWALGALATLGFAFLRSRRSVRA